MQILGNKRALKILKSSLNIFGTKPRGFGVVSSFLFGDRQNVLLLMRLASSGGFDLVFVLGKLDLLNSY